MIAEYTDRLGMEENMVFFFKSIAQFSGLATAAVEMTEDSMVFFSGLSFMLCNGVLEKQMGALTEERVDALLPRFEGRPFVWWTKEWDEAAADVLKGKGFVYGGSMQGLALDIAEGFPEAPVVPCNMTIKRVSTDEERELFWHVAGKAFRFSRDMVEEWTSVSKRLPSGEFIDFLAFLDDHPVGSATLVVHGARAGVWNLGTLPDLRGMGIGSFLTFECLEEARRLNKEKVFALLPPEGIAAPVFRNLGFKDVCHFPIYTRD